MFPWLENTTTKKDFEIQKRWWYLLQNDKMIYGKHFHFKFFQRFKTLKWLPISIFFLSLFFNLFLNCKIYSLSL